MKARTKSIPIEKAISMMYAVLSPFIEPTNSEAKMIIQRVLAKHGISLE
jgi:hypothetical protein